MEKKRRDFIDCEVLDLTKSKSTISEMIAIETDFIEYEGVIFKEYHVLPKFGQGTIINFDMESIDITISRFKLEKDFIIYNKGNTDFIQLSFLLEGQKIISLDYTDSDILYEEQESYLVNINSFKGYSRISGGKLFKEIKIKLSKYFLLMYGFTNNFMLKKIVDKDIIIPITNELLTILNDLENKNFKGITQKIYLKAKVFELLALQIENYKNSDTNNLMVSKTIKKLYLVRQIIIDKLEQNFSINQLSKKVLLNEFELKSEFKRIFGYSIKKFSAMEKMNKAKSLLSNTQLPIYQIAEDVGYKNATHFSAAFKKSFGLTPKKFRNLI